MDALTEFLNVPYRSGMYNKQYILRNLLNKNVNGFEFNYFIKVAELGEGFEFGGDALVNNKPRNATIVAETETVLATLDKRPFDNILKKHKKRVEDRAVDRLSRFSFVENFSKTFKIKILKFLKEEQFKKGQYLYQENDEPDSIYLLLEGTIVFQKEFQIIRSEEKDSVHYAKFEVKKKKNDTTAHDVFQDDIDHFKKDQNKKIAVGGSIRPNVSRKTVTVAKVEPFEVIGAEEIMFDSPKRFITAVVQSKSASLLKLKKSDMKNLMLSNSKKVSITDSIEDRLQGIAWNKLTSLTQKIKNLKNVTENMGNKMKKKQVLVDQKSFEEVKFKIDREYEKVFLKQMTKMKIIKPSKVIKDANKQNADYPVTSFYNQLIKDDRKSLEPLKDYKSVTMPTESLTTPRSKPSNSAERSKEIQKSKKHRSSMPTLPKLDSKNLMENSKEIHQDMSKTKGNNKKYLRFIIESLGRSQSLYGF